MALRTITWARLRSPEVRKVDTLTDTTEVTSADQDEAGAGRKRRGAGLDSMVLPELKQLASTLGLKGTGAMRKSQLIDAIRSVQNGSPATRPQDGQAPARRDDVAAALDDLQRQPREDAAPRERQDVAPREPDAVPTREPEVERAVPAAERAGEGAGQTDAERTDSGDSCGATPGLDTAPRESRLNDRRDRRGQSTAR